MQEVVRSVHEVSAIMRDIGTAASEQAARIEQVNEAIKQLDVVTQQNASQVEEAAAAAAALHEQANTLVRLASVFKLAHGGAHLQVLRSSARAAPPPSFPRTREPLRA
jgi:methyl-accepting chemotaxis protein